MLPFLSSNVSPADTSKNILNKKFLPRQMTWWESQKGVNLMIATACKKIKQCQELKKLKVMLLETCDDSSLCGTW